MRALAVVPAYQSSRWIADVVTGLSRCLPQTGLPQVLVVDDGSTDGTGELADRAGAMVVRHPENRGKGAALRTGFQHALTLGAEVAVTVDADAQHPPEEARRLLDAPAAADALVLGVRDLAAAGAPVPNRISNRISNFFLSAFGGQRLLDTQCGLRRYPLRRTLALGATADGYAYEAEVVLRAVRAGWDVVHVPIRVIYPPESERVSHFDAVRDPARIVARVLSTLATPRGPRP